MNAQFREEAHVLCIIPVLGEAALLQARTLFREYGATPDVFECLHDFELEVASLPGPYATPSGRLLLAVSEGEKSADAAGCGAFSRLDRGVCEMKRLYIRPAFRGKGIGEMLVAALIAEARSAGYEKMVLDTLPSMQQAQRLYKRFGFRETPSYQAKPIPRALFFELALRSGTPPRIIRRGFSGFSPPDRNRFS